MGLRRHGLIGVEVLLDEARSNVGRPLVGRRLAAEAASAVPGGGWPQAGDEPPPYELRLGVT